MLEVYRAAADLQRHCEDRGWRFCLIGGIALQRWGEPRETIDVDVTLLTGFGHEEEFVRELLSWYEARVPEPLAFALANRVLLLQAPSGAVLRGRPTDCGELVQVHNDRDIVQASPQELPAIDIVSL